ncbi:hypothetical protein [Plantactinospora sonchi]|uniref:Uncharacterized protein n=1 Tax=Plantactinospora sonchi TaxID=1544735 RepID=A0ABU7S082_9ACTN
MTAVQVLLECCEPKVLPDVLTRRRQAAEEVLRHASVLGATLVRAVLDSGDDGLRLALAGNRAFPASHPEAAAELAATATAPIAAALLRHGDAKLRAEVLAVVDPADPWWRRPGGFVPTLVDRARYEWQMITDLAGTTPFEEIDHVFLSLDRARTARRELEVLAHVWRRAGRDAVAGYPTAQFDPLVAESLADALGAEDGVAALERATHELETAAGVARLLRAVDRGTAELAPDQLVDWSAVVAGDAEQPYGAAAAKALGERADCPDALRTSFVHRFGVDVLNWFPGPVGLPVMLACAEELANGNAVVTGTRLLGEKVAEALEQGTVTAAQVVERLAPVGCLPGVAVMAEPLRTAVGELVGATVGTDPGAWRALWKHLSSWPGSLPELLAAATATAGEVRRWANARPAPALDGKPPAWTRSRRAFRDLLLCCPTETVMAILPVLDGRATYDLLHRGTVGPELVAALIDTNNLAHLRLLAGNRDLPADTFDALLAYDDTEINTGLYQSPHATPAVRRRILAGLRHDEAWPGGTDRLPLGDRLRAHLLEPAERRFMLPWIESGLTELAVELMRRTRVPTGLLQLRMVLAVARREGVPAARALFEVDLTRRAYQGNPWLVAVRKAAAGALDGPDEAAAVRAVQALVDRESTPDKWLGRLRRADPMAGDLHILEAEQHVTDWTLLLAEHRREPFPYGVLVYLGKLPGCPAELVAEVAAGPPSTDGSDGPVVPPTTPDGSVDWTDWATWAPRAVAAGTVPLADLATTAAPVSALLRAGGKAGWWRTADDPLPGLCREVLGENLDGWLLALDLVDNFPGTLPELLTTSRMATAVLSPH